MNKKQRIVAIIRAEYEKALAAYHNAHAERVGIDAAANAWDDFNPEDGVGGIGMNPHNTIAASKREESSRFPRGKVEQVDPR